MGQEDNRDDEEEGEMKIELSFPTKVSLTVLFATVLGIVFGWPMLNSLRPGWQEDGLILVMLLVILVELSIIFDNSKP